MRDWSHLSYWPFIRALHLETNKALWEEAFCCFASLAITPEPDDIRGGAPELGIRLLWQAPQLELLPESAIDILLSAFRSINSGTKVISIANLLGWLPQSEGLVLKMRKALETLPQDPLPKAILGLQFALGQHNNPAGKEVARTYIAEKIARQDVGVDGATLRAAMIALRKHASDIDAELLQQAAAIFGPQVQKEEKFRTVERAKSVQLGREERVLTLLKTFHLSRWHKMDILWGTGEFISEYYWESGWELALEWQQKKLEEAASILTCFSAVENKELSETVLGPWKYDQLEREGPVDVKKALLARFTHRHLFKEPMW